MRPASSATLQEEGVSSQVPEPPYLVGVQAAALQAVAPEGQHTVLQTH